MIKHSLKKWFAGLLVAMLGFVSFGALITNAATVNPLTDVVITKVETTDSARDMTLSELANGVDIATYFSTGAKVIPGVSFTYFSVTEQQLNTMEASPSSYDTAAEVQAYVGSAGVHTADTNVNGQVTLQDLPEGFYWIVENTKATIASSTAVPFALTLPFTNLTGDDYLETIYVYPKNTLQDLPDIDKTVNEGIYEDDAAIGEINTWNVSLSIPEGVEDFVTYGFIDEIDDRLDFQGVGTVTASAVGVTLVRGTDYLVTYDNTAGQIGQYGPLAGLALEGVLSVHFTEAGRDKLALATSTNVEISFETKINDKAIMGQDIFNNAVFEFDNGHGRVSNPNEDIPPIPPKVYTGGKAFMKVDATTEAPLAGAEFIVRDATGNFAILDPTTGAVTFGAEADATVLTSSATGLFEIKGLPYGSYTLIETKAPTGYALPTNQETPFTVNATSYYTDPTVITDPGSPANNELYINNIRITIPQTGGTGTVLFTLLGGFLMVLSLLYYRRSVKE